MKAERLTVQRGAPLVSVIMPAYNAAGYVREAVESIISQSFRDFELLVIDDCSTDDSLGVLTTLSDPRLRVWRAPHNRGVSPTLNELLSAARGKYIARADADDICMPDRLEAQVRFMDAHPTVGICGMWCAGFGDGHVMDFRPAVGDAALRLELFFDNPIPHPTVMLRSQFFRDGALNYDPGFAGAEDYDLWVRASEHCEMAVIPQVGVKYRFHAAQATSNRMKLQRDFAARVRRVLATRLVPDASSAELEIHDRVFCRQPEPDRKWISNAGAWLSRLIEANDSAGTYSRAIFRARVAQIFADDAMLAASRGLGIWRAYHKLPLARHAELSMWEKVTFAARSLAGTLRQHL